MLGHRFFQPLTSFESLTAFAQLPEEASVFLYEECSLGHFKNNEEQWGLTQGAIYALFFFYEVGHTLWQKQTLFLSKGHFFSTRRSTTDLVQTLPTFLRIMLLLRYAVACHE